MQRRGNQIGTIARILVRYTALIGISVEAYNGGQRSVAEVLRCADRWGREIVLYEDTWYGKIVGDHADMVDRFDAVTAVLADPERVHFDAAFPNGENFYGRDYPDHPFGVDYLKIVVRYDLVGAEEIGTIVSAYPAPHYRKHGERFKWQRR